MADLIDRQAAIDALSCSITITGIQNAELVAAIIGTFLDRIKALPSAQPEPQRMFVELVVEYQDPELCTYKEYKGKPYYSIKYIENGETYVGYGTYNPKVLSRYLSEYFISSTQQWHVITKRPMTEDERKEWSERLGYDIKYDDAFIYSNLPQEGK